MRKGIHLGADESPCKDCKKRFLGCHSVCKEYFDFVAENAANRRIRQLHAENQNEVEKTFRKLSTEINWKKRV